MKDICHKCSREYELRPEAGAGVCDRCRFGEVTDAKKNAAIWKQLATDALLVLQAFSVGHSTQLAIEKALANDGV